MQSRYVTLHFCPAVRTHAMDFTSSLLRSCLSLSASPAGLGLDVLGGRGALHCPVPIVQALRALMRVSAVARTPPIDSFRAFTVLETFAQFSTIIVVRLPVYGTVADGELRWWWWASSVGRSGDGSG